MTQDAAASNRDIPAQRVGADNPGSTSALPDAVEMARRMVAGNLRPGDIAIDATVGNGHDTLWLAELVGDNGLVIGCDIQEAAITATRQRLETASLVSRVQLLFEDHSRLGEVIAPEQWSRVAAVMFNLGYLPSSDKTVTTLPETTLAALAAVSSELPNGALMTVVAYPGHPGGTEERDAVQHWAAALNPDHWRTQQWRALNRKRPAPELFVIKPLAGSRLRTLSDSRTANIPPSTTQGQRDWGNIPN